MPRLKKEKYEKIIENYLSGMTQQETADANDVGRDPVLLHLLPIIDKHSVHNDILMNF